MIFLIICIKEVYPSSQKGKIQISWGAVSSINVWIQGEAADNVSEKLGKNLQCRAVTLSDIKKQVDAMMGAIKNL